MAAAHDAATQGLSGGAGASFAKGLGVRPWGEHRPEACGALAVAGDLVGQRNLAARYFTGGAVEQGFARVAAVYRAAAAVGDGPAQDMPSAMLVEGKVMSPDYAKAPRWALAAAEQGIAAAITRLGMMFHNALGVPRDPAQAVHWWCRGAQRGAAGGALASSLLPPAGVVAEIAEAQRHAATLLSEVEA
jgi:uncharacterized protein